MDGWFTHLFLLLKDTECIFLCIWWWGGKKKVFIYVFIFSRRPVWPRIWFTVQRGGEDVSQRGGQPIADGRQRPEALVWVIDNIQSLSDCSYHSCRSKSPPVGSKMGALSELGCYSVGVMHSPFAVIFKCLDRFYWWIGLCKQVIVCLSGCLKFWCRMTTSSLSVPAVL